MCDLLGMCFNLPVKPNFSFKNFRFKDRKNKNGWGIAFYPDNSAQVIKEEIEASESQLAEMLVNYDYVKSKIVIAHVRASSGTQPSHKNTHPFSRELNGEEWVFAHNGTLNEDKLKELITESQFQPLGNTDSELAFCYLLNLIKKRNIKDWTSGKDFGWLKEIIRKLNEFGTFNCIFSNGNLLFCYADKNQYNKLSFIQRKTPFGQIHLLDLDKRHPRQGYVNLGEEKDSAQEGYLISTTDRTGKPTDEKWTLFNGGELKVFKNGNII